MLTATPNAVTVSVPEPTPLAKLDAVVERLSGKVPIWTATTPRERAGIVRECLRGVLAVAEPWVDVACRAQGIDPRSDLAGELWGSGPLVTVRNLRLFAETLETWGKSKPPPLTRHSDGRRVARVFPSTLLDRAVFAGIRADLWLREGDDATRGRIYRDRDARAAGAGVALVLGAGNVGAIGPLDAIHKLIVDNEVVVLKMNPVNAYLGPLFERAFVPLIERGFLAVVYGGAEEGHHLCHHPGISSVHLTGSHLTHDAILWGADTEERQRRKAAGTPLLDKPVSSELGCVTPVIIVPGRWSKAEMAYQARHVAGMVVNNASFNCNAAKVLVVSDRWPQRQEFLERLRAVLETVPARPAYYPGAGERYARFLREYPQAHQVEAVHPIRPGVRSGVEQELLPWTLIPGISSRDGELALGVEAFCGVLAELALPAGDAREFLETAVGFANKRVWGTLSCVLLIDPRTARTAASALDRAIADLRYGAIGVNVWSALAFALGSTSWGAYPGHTLDDVGSGIGAVHNTYLFDSPEKSIVRGPFRAPAWMTPPWLTGHRNLTGLMRRLTYFEAAPSWRQLPGVAAAAMRG